MKKQILALLFAAPLLAFAADFVADDEVLSDGIHRIPKNSHYAETRAKVLKRLGGFLVKPDSQKGKLVVFDAQSTIASTNIEKFCKFMGQCTKFKFEYRKIAAAELQGADYPALMAKHGGAVMIAFIEDPKSASSLLVSPDEKWATINISRLDRGLKTPEAKEKFVKTRATKDMIRALVMICGIQTAFKNSPVMTNSMEDLDLKRELVPGDQLQRIDDYLMNLGLTKKQFASYRQACEQGWAPNPTNDIQQAIWKEVHEIPSKSLKIEYNEKRDKGK